MSYHFSKTLNCSVDKAIEHVTEELKKEGFGIVTEIDVGNTLKEKMDVDIPVYRILGACNPQVAYKALSIENKIGTMLPCNVVVQQHADGSVEISAVDPVASMMAVNNPVLENLLMEIREKLKRVIENL